MDVPTSLLEKRMPTPRILIVYGTTHGQTAAIAAFLQLTLEQRSCQVVVSNVREPPTPPLNHFDGIIVGASVIARGHQPAIAAFIRDNVETLNAMPSAFLSVSASAGSSREEGRAAARRLRDGFLAETGFHPALTECIAGAIKYTKYNFLLRWYMKKASRMNGGSTDTTRDHEYTNWEQVATFAGQFASKVTQSHLEAIPEVATT
jgi:menaquinone-dependent protoporphyrinogen oxidase